MNENVIPLRRVEPARPFINGKSFSDLWHVKPEGWAMLYERGLVYCTTLMVGGEAYCGHIIAGSREHAEQLAVERGYGETVDGVVGGIILA